jgi:hypothetical protein
LLLEWRCEEIGFGGGIQEVRCVRKNDDEEEKEDGGKVLVSGTKKKTEVRVLDSRTRNRKKKKKTEVLEAILLAIVAIVVVVGVLYRIWPREPRFEVTDVHLKGFKLNWETDSVVPIVAVDIDLTISIKVTNPNVVPIEYTSTIVNLLYRGTSIGEAMVRTLNNFIALSLSLSFALILISSRTHQGIRNPYLLLQNAAKLVLYLLLMFGISLSSIYLF